MRDYVVSDYSDKADTKWQRRLTITSLSTTDNNLFYNKTLNALSLKLIFSIGNQKPSTAASN